MLFFLGMLTAVLVLSGDQPKQGGLGEKQAPNSYAGVLYTFEPGRDQPLGAARPIKHLSPTTTADALKILAADLENGYFFKTPGGGSSRIRFNIDKIQTIHAGGRRHCVAVVDLQDARRLAHRYFFQGSFGGRTTFFMIAATFLQAQNDPPLLDGLILLYNGHPFPQMDHIDFTGIVTPAAVLRTVRRVTAAAGVNRQ